MCSPIVKRTEFDEVRRERGLSRERLAAVMGASALSVKRWERQYAGPNDHNRCKLTEFIGATKAELDRAPFQSVGTPVRIRLKTEAPHGR